MTLYSETRPLRTNWLPEANGHAVYWETFGNPDGPAILMLHGGPGGGIKPRMPRLFDPSIWHIIAMDQRGAGRSTPHAGESLDALISNTTQHLVSDIERLRQILSIEKWTLYGSSWGATLAQAYAHEFQSHVSGLILAAVTSMSYFEIDFLCGGAGDFLPEAYDAFQAGAPEGRKGIDMARAYCDRLMASDLDIANRAALDWCKWEKAILLADPRAELPTHFDDPRFALGFSRVVTHYFRDLAWLEPPLLDRAKNLSDIPAVLINSRFDLSTPLSTAWHLHKAMPSSELVIIPGGLHGTLYGPLAQAVVDAGNKFAAIHQNRR